VAAQESIESTFATVKHLKRRKLENPPTPEECEKAGGHCLVSDGISLPGNPPSIPRSVSIVEYTVSAF
jgi:hypothetical protein